MSDIYTRAHDAVFWTLVIGCSLLSAFAFLAWLADLCERQAEPPDIGLDILDFKPRTPDDC